MQLITSKHNPVIKEIRSLTEKKPRTEKGLFFIEGIKPLHEALDEKVDIKYVVLSEFFQHSSEYSLIIEKVRSAARSINVYTVTDRLFKDIAATENPQGVMAVVGMQRFRLEEAKLKDGFWVILDTIQDPGNLGTIIRTSDAAGASGVIISRGCTDPYNPKAIRSAMASVFHIPLYFTESIPETLSYLRNNGTKIYASHLKGSYSYFNVDMRGNVAIIIGNEAGGINEETASCADLLIKIPMPGRAESLNVSAAAAVLLYEAVRQRTAINRICE